MSFFLFQFLLVKKLFFLSLYWICYNIASLFLMFWFFGCEACSILASQPGVEPTPLMLMDKVITTEPSGKYVFFIFFL